MRLAKSAHLVDRIISLISGGLHSVGVTILAAIMVLTFTDVTLRYAFNRPIVGSYEITEFMMAIFVTFSVAYCGAKKGHVTVEAIVSRFSQRVQGIIDSITCLLGLFLFSLITWQCVVFVKDKLDAGLTSGTLLISVFPFVGVVALGSAMFCLVLIGHFLTFLAKAVEK